MALENWQKVKIFRLAELLRQETDEEHPLKTAQICSELEEMGIPCDRRTLAVDIELLNSEGMEIKWKWAGKSKAFYVEDRSLSEPELKVLIDAVQAVSFIPEEQTEELVDKIAALGGTHKNRILKGNLVHFNVRKRSDESSTSTVAELEKAIQQRKKIKFSYYDLEIGGEKAYRNDGQLYEEEPVTLVFDEDHYYLITYNEQDDETENFRVDRMDGIEVTEEKISKTTMQLKRRVGRNKGQAFKMYRGQSQAVWLEFDSSLIDAVYDRFGEDTEMAPSGEDKVTASVLAHLDSAFWGWLFQFGEKMKVIGPEEVSEEYQERIMNLLPERND